MFLLVCLWLFVRAKEKGDSWGFVLGKASVNNVAIIVTVIVIIVVSICITIYCFYVSVIVIASESDMKIKSKISSVFPINIDCVFFYYY